MKKYLLLFLFSLSVWSCVSRQWQMELSDLESQLAEAPDSVLHVLTGMDCTVMDEAGQAYYKLLYAMAQDKCYIDETDDRSVRSALSYYSSFGKDIKHLMLSWYMLGRIQMNAGDREHAVISMLEAEDLASQMGDCHYLGLITRYLAVMYGESYDAERSVEYWERSVKYFEEIGEKKYSSYSEYALAREMATAGNPHGRDSILACLSPYAETNDKYLYGQILKAQAFANMYPTILNPRKAIELSVEGVGFTGEFFLEDAGLLALSYAAINQKDTSDYYLDLAEKASRSQLDTAKVLSYKYLIAEQKKDYASAYEYLTRAVDLQNHLMYTNRDQVITNSITNHYQIKNENAKALISIQKRKMLWLTIALVLGLILIVQLASNYRRKIREKNRKLLEQEMRLQEEIQRSKEIARELENSVKGKSKQANKVVQLLRNEIAIIKQWSDAYYYVSATEDEREAYIRFLDGEVLPDKKKQEVIKHFCKSLNKIRQNDTLYADLEDGVNTWKDGIMSKLRIMVQENPNRKKWDDTDYHIITLLFAEVPDKAIAFMMDMSYGAIRMRKSRYRAAFREMGPSAQQLLKEMGE